MIKKLTIAEFNEFIHQKHKKPYENISTTAWTVAYRRTFSDIPYAKEIYRELEKMRLANKEPDLPDEYKFMAMVPLFEARHKLLNKLTLKANNKQILDIASGLTPRGLEMTEQADIEYVEFDLPKMMSEKRKIVDNILRHNTISKRENLHLEAGDATKLADLERATIHFKPNQPLTVITEGLLRYLNAEEKIIIAKNIKLLLARFGGVWLTPDIIYKRNQRPDFIANNERVAKLTGIDLESNKFPSIEAAQDFFNNLGFKVEIHRFMDVYSDLVTPALLNMPISEVEEIVGPRVVFEMRPVVENTI